MKGANPEWKLAAKWLEDHPEHRNHSLNKLCRLPDADAPKVSKWTWHYARKQTGYEPDLSTRVKPTVEKTIVAKPRKQYRSIRIDIVKGIATDTVNGKPTTTPIKHVYEIVKFYEYLNYGVIWLSPTTVLLAKRKAKAA